VTARTAETPPLRLARGAVATVLLGGAALVALHDWLGLGSSSLDSFVNGHLYDSVIVAAGLACLLKARVAERERAACLVLAAAIFSWAAAEIYWTEAIAGNPSAPYPSPADVGYLAFYPLALAGVYLLVRARERQLDWQLWMDALIAALGTAAIGSAFVLEFVADHTGGSTVEVATTLAYPFGDILLLALVVGVVVLTRWHPGRTWLLLLAGLAVMSVADVAYTLQSTDTTLPAGDWIEPIYLIAAVCLGLAAWQREPEPEPIEPAGRLGGWRELAVPGTFAAIMLCLIALQRFDHAGALTTALWTATMLAVVLRLAISVRENGRLLEEVRTDPLTGLGSQGRMQIDLEDRCGRTASHPLILVLYDLNGFKRYNDTFGHLAGDEMLAQLGRRLAAAVAEDGTAYRIGGDEFAVLVEHAQNRGNSVTRRAAEALSARGAGYEVGASWGSVTIPAETDSPETAMRLADARMYAQKESRRLSGGRDPLEIDGSDIRVEGGGGSGSLGPRPDSETLEQGS
jgi:two-component system cell cycle response regulator